MYERLVTARLSARPIASDDLELLRQIHGDRRAMATLSVDGCPHSEARSRQLLEQYCNQWRERRYGLWMFHDRRHGSFVGYSGLLESPVRPYPSVALAYAVTASQWRQGFAVEMSRAVLEMAFHELNLPEVIVYTLPLNYGSRNVIRQLGFEYEGETIHAGLPHVLFRMREPPTAGVSVGGRAEAAR